MQLEGQKNINNYTQRTRSLKIVMCLRKCLLAGKTVTKFRETPEAFSRNRILTLPVVVLLILRAHKVSLQIGLTAVFESLKQIGRVPSASAYSQARQKLKPEIFISGP